MIRRNNFQIARDILIQTEGGAGVTRIVYQSNLNFLVVKPYLHDLIANGLMVKDGPMYFTTDTGRAFIRGVARTEDAWAGIPGVIIDA
jgi:predicted transcriptional regulator